MNILTQMTRIKVCHTKWSTNITEYHTLASSLIYRRGDVLKMSFFRAVVNLLVLDPWHTIAVQLLCPDVLPCEMPSGLLSWPLDPLREILNETSRLACLCLHRQLKHSVNPCLGSAFTLVLNSGPPRQPFSHHQDHNKKGYGNVFALIFYGPFSHAKWHTHGTRMSLD